MVHSANYLVGLRRRLFPRLKSGLHSGALCLGGVKTVPSPKTAASSLMYRRLYRRMLDSQSKYLEIVVRFMDMGGLKVGFQTLVFRK
jgi:hypothetical protein